MENWTPETVNALGTVAIAALTLLLVVSAIGNIVQASRARKPTLGIDVTRSGFVTAIVFGTFPSSERDGKYDFVSFATIFAFTVELRNNYSQENTILETSVRLDGNDIHPVVRSFDYRVYNGTLPTRIRRSLFDRQSSYKDIDKSIGESFLPEDGNLSKLLGDLSVGRHKLVNASYIRNGILINPHRTAKIEIKIRDVYQTHTVLVDVPYDAKAVDSIPF